MKTILLLILIILSGCSNNQSSVERKTYDYTDVDDQIKWAYVFTQQEEKYLVYFFSKTCGHCSYIKQEIISYYKSEKEDMYFCETSEDTVFGNKSDIRGINNINDFYIFGTPFLIKIYKGIVSSFYSGTTEILEYINSKN